ncbi:LacI family DNA-binding transcriptional regulator [Arthrobacter psychrochitiniphilus]|uniref:LacI family transcriptional regulator n=1 Tax=Arthrobacter psychrochitiniphilus TaxID=291045 RepID=A0A2V3DP68_9MICC|nr:LacI family DNA-binding transcriptional regulator [Arthrobacter psychrochitiniphilus]NYG17007.1 LacI family transcriptional regulator [Arthrobacter psychrochitiniphilus]PXA64773.1 LacI family transcriptional regulator [Arthrobacter psychrochitiniphilus]
MPVKLTEVARLAGVSLATASRVLNGSSRNPAADITERVRVAAEELGYVANAQAQALARSTTGLVGLVVHDIADPYFSAIAHGVQEVALKSRRQVLLAGTDFGGGDGATDGSTHSATHSAELAAVNAFISYRTDAIILATSRFLEEDPLLSRNLERYIKNGGRVVTLGATSIPHAKVISIGNFEGARDLVAALVDRGLVRFAILSGPHDRNTARSRVSGFHQALTERELTPLAVVEGEFSSRGGFNATLECLDTLEIVAAGTSLDSPLCILAANDVMALGAMTALRSRGLRIPEDVQVAGFDDIPTLRDHFPGLSTYRLPLEEIGRLAATLALEAETQTGSTVTGTVVLRESAGTTASSANGA